MDNTLTTTKNKQILEWTLRILIAALFLVSVIGKLYPAPSVYNTLSAFEAKQLFPMGFDGNFAQWFSRTLIGCELALGLLILQPHFYKKLVIPVSILMLLVFCIHLTYEIATKGNVGNCGCFGEFLPMSPLAAIIKNVIAMGALAYLYKLRKSVADKTNFAILSTATFGSIMLVFMLGMKKSSVGQIPLSTDTIEIEEDTTSATANEPSTIDSSKTVSTSSSSVKTSTTTTVDGKVVEVKPEVVEEPKAAKSGYKHLYGDIDKGRKILCFFAAGCDHCQETAKELTAMSKQVADFPEMKIIFLEEETELIPNFFNIAGKTYPYKILDPGAFYTLLGPANTPMVNYLWNGNKVKVYEGTEGNAFKKAEFKTIIQKSWKELKK